MDKKLLDTEFEFAAKCNDGKDMDLTNKYFRDIIIDNNFENIKNLLEKNINLVNSPILMNGYTPLHLACLMGHNRVIHSLIKLYHADVNVVAEDGIQPIHLASFSGRSGSTLLLSRAGANIDAIITKDMYLKYKKFYHLLSGTMWCSNFGDAVTLVTFFIVCFNEPPQVLDNFIEHGANLNVRSFTNKTLLMYACRKDVYLGGITNANNFNAEYVNDRDNDGLAAVHHLFLIAIFDPMIQSETENRKIQSWIILKSWGADISATANDDPDTFLINIVARHCQYKILEIMLPHYSSIKKSKALQIVTEDFEDFEEFFNFLPTSESAKTMSIEYKVKSVITVLKDLICRLSFGLFVPEKERKQMNKLIAKYTSIETFARNYQENVINGILKNKVIQYGEKSITFYDLISASVTYRKLLLLIKDQLFLNTYRKSDLYCDSNFYFSYLTSSFLANEDHILYFRIIITEKVEKALPRIELLEKLKKVRQLRKAIPLPFEIVLEIVEYLENEDLENFINAFISN